MASTPPCRVLLRSKQRLEVFTVASESSSSNGEARRVLLENCSSTIHTCTASDGSFTLVHVSGVGIVKCDLTDNGDSSTTVPLPKAAPKAFFANTAAVQMMQLSPTAAYLLTWERYKEHDAVSGQNLKVWHTHNGQLMAAFVQKNISSESWPYLQWTMDETYAFLLCNNSQIRVYAADDLLHGVTNTGTTAPSNGNGTTDGTTTAVAATTEPRFIDKVQVASCSTLSVHRHALGDATSTSPLYYFTTFSKKTKDKPAVACIYMYSSSAVAASTTSTSAASNKFTVLASKSLFQAEECTTRWSPIPTSPACLLTLQTAVDATGQSYYGNSQLWLWNSATTNEVTAVPLPQQGPVQDCQWLPDPTKPPSFIVIAGSMPAMASQHHGVTGAVTFLFGNNVHRNTVATCRHHARFVCLAGFGNLAGGMGFWDVNKKKLIPHVAANVNGTLRSEPVTMHGWSPDSRLFLTATTAPRMNVDNGVRLYKYSGELVQNLPWNNADYQPNLLLEACFVPAAPNVYTDRPQSPVPEAAPGLSDAPTGPVSTSTPSSTSTTAAPPPAAPAGRYVPPSARNRAGGSSLAERLRAEKEGSLQGATKVGGAKASTLAAASTSVKSAVTGRVIPGLTVTPAATKSKSQLKREKLKQKEAASATATEQPTPTPTDTPAAASIPAATDAAAADPSSLDPEKRARKLKKVLKQIDDLKSMPPNDLNDDQKAKLASEDSLRAELAQLGL